jgi:hypothetical protein
LRWTGQSSDVDMDELLWACYMTECLLKINWYGDDLIRLLVKTDFCADKLDVPCFTT